MRRWALILTVLVAATLGPSAAAQETVEIEAAVGLDGYVHPDRPTSLLLTVKSPSLFVGSVEVSMASFQTAIPVEVPSDGFKELIVDLPAPGGAANILVRLVDSEGDSVLARDLRVSLDTGLDQILTGILGSAQIESTVRQVRSEPLLLPVTPISLADVELDDRLSALDYLVAEQGSLASRTAAERAAVLEWLEAGGRMITSEAGAGELGLPIQPQGMFGVAQLAEVGLGEMLLVENPAGVDVADWPRLLRDVPQSLAGVNGVGFQEQNQFNLIQAASSGGGAALPQIPWLAFALVGYGVIVGPVNFYVLRRMRRPELAWLTIPVLSVMTVGLFWLNGPRGNKAAVSHASVMVFDQETPRAESGLVMVTGTEGTHRLSTQAGWSLMPSSAFGQSSVVGSQTTADGSSIDFDLQSLEAATAVAGWTPSAVPLSATVAPDGNAFAVTISNDSNLSFWSWGVVSGFDVAGRNSTLAAGESADARLRLTGTGDPWEPPMARVSLQGNFNFSERDPWATVYPLSQHLGSRFRDSIDGVYLFGFTDDVELAMQVDGAAVTSTGTALVVVPLADGVIDGGAVSNGELVYAEGAQWVESSGWSTFVGGADAVYVRFDAPGPVRSGRISEGFNFGVNNSYSIYDWQLREFVALEGVDEFSGESLFTPSGELLVRMTPGEEFADIVPDTIRVEWDA